MLANWLSIAWVLGVGACSSKSSTDKAPAASPDKTTPRAATAWWTETARIATHPDRITPEAHLQWGLRFSLPPDWQPRDPAEFGRMNEQIWGPKPRSPQDFDVRLTANVMGGSGVSSWSKDLETIAAAKSKWATPGIQIPNERLQTRDGCETRVSKLAWHDLPHGRMLQRRVDSSCASGVPYADGKSFEVTCWFYDPGDRYVVALEGIGRQSREDPYLETLMKICRSVELEGRVPNEAERHPPITVTHDGFMIEALPAGSYRLVEGTNEEPSVIALAQPVIYNGAPMSAGWPVLTRRDGEIYQFTLAKNHAFLSDASVEIPCLAEYEVTLAYGVREPSAKMTKCTLAAPVTVEGTTYAAYTELKIELGKITGTPAAP